MARFLLLVLLALACQCAPPPSPAVPAAAQASDRFDVKAAVDAWLASVPAADRKRSDAYFEGGYWLQLWEFLYTSALALLMLETRLSARMRDLAARWTRRPSLQVALYWGQYLMFVTLVTFPLTVYEGFFREHQYGLSNQNFASWFGDQAKELAIASILGALFLMAIFAAVRKLPRTWHIWGAAISVAFLAFAATIGPVFLAPLFNTYTTLKDPRIEARILRLARANGIPVTHVYQVDASRQSKRISANVSGLFGTDRVTLNDNLLNRCSESCVLAVMGHEMGHYVLHHIYVSILFFGVTVTIGFTLLRKSLDAALARRGERWGIRAVADPAVLPLAFLLLGILGLVSTPVSNTFTRTQEFEADMYGLNAAREPDGEAEADLLLGEYRKLDPGPVEEWIFFDHPSGRTRITAAMRWKAGNSTK